MARVENVLRENSGWVVFNSVVSRNQGSTLTVVFAFTLTLMTSKISGPFCDLDFEPDQYTSFVWELSHVRQQISVVFEDFYR